MEKRKQRKKDVKKENRAGEVKNLERRNRKHKRN